MATVDNDTLWGRVADLIAQMRPMDTCDSAKCTVQKAIGDFIVYARVANGTDPQFDPRCLQFLEAFWRPIVVERSNFVSVWTPYEHLAVDKVHGKGLTHANIIWYLVAIIDAIVKPVAGLVLTSLDDCQSLAASYSRLLGVPNNVVMLRSFAKFYGAAHGRFNLKSDNRVIRKVVELICQELTTYLDRKRSARAKFEITNMGRDTASAVSASNASSTSSNVDSTSSAGGTSSKTPSRDLPPATPSVLGKRFAPDQNTSTASAKKSTPLMSGWIQCDDVKLLMVETSVTRPTFTLDKSAIGHITGEAIIGDLRAKIFGVHDGNLTMHFTCND